MSAMRFGGFRLLGLIILCSQAIGCGGGDGLPRKAVSGVVTLDGQPLPTGIVEFMPSGPEQVTAGSAPVEAGAFSIPSDRGFIPGRYVVRIYGAATAAAAPSPDAMPGDPGPPTKEPIPAKYNTQTKLVAEVDQGTDNHFTFELVTR